jgi:hypothetical protein
MATVLNRYLAGREEGASSLSTQGTRVQGAAKLEAKLIFTLKSLFCTQQILK